MKYLRKFFIYTGFYQTIGWLLRSGLLPRKLEFLAPQYLDFPSGFKTQIKRRGFILDIDLNDLPEWKIFFRKKDRKRDWLYSKLESGWKTIEVGANNGWVALQISRAVGKNGTYLGFEINPQAANIAQNRLKANSLSNAEIWNIPIGRKKSKINFNVKSPSNSASFTAQELVNENSQLQQFEIDSLDNLLSENKISAPNFVKITVNGFEMEVLKGMEKIIKNHHPSLMLEIGDQNLRKQGSNAKELVEFLFEHGYQLQNIDRKGNLHDFNTNQNLSDCLFDIWAF